MRIRKILHRPVPISRYAPEISAPPGLDTSIVAVVTDHRLDGSPIIGYGFASIGRYAQDGLIEARFAPRLLRAKPADLLDRNGHAIDPLCAWHVMMAGEKPGGHGERSVAVGALDMALWDAAAKAKGLPLYRLLAERFLDRAPSLPVPVYASGGYLYPDNDLGRLRSELERFRDLGFAAAKIKVGALDRGQDARRIETALDVMGGGESLAIDAMNAYAPDEAHAAARRFEPYALRWFEDICDPLDYRTHQEIAQSYRPPISAGEALFSFADARNLLRYAGLRPGHDVLTFDPAHGYGIGEFSRILALLRRHGWSSEDVQPHGGHLYGLHLAAGLRLGGCECNPHSFQPFGGFGDDTVVRHGRVLPPNYPGIGFESRGALMDLFRSLAA